ncbi:MAG: hypothetical protein QUS66_01765, partial [Bacteroidota bacterium]|nr:hypothetical protein [Bacteroidota bacterium]
DNQERVIVAGSSNNIKCNDDAVIWRFDRWGCPDRTFGTGGSVVLDNPAGVIDFSGYNEPICDYAKSLYLDKSGRILITGHSSGWTFISRLEPDGAMDPNFAYWGSLSIYTGEAWYANNDIFTDRFGKIILKSHKSVYDSAGFRSHILLWRFK